MTRLALPVFACLLGAAALAQELVLAAQELASKMPPGEVTLDVRNLAADAAQAADARKSFEAALRSRGVRVVESAAASVRLTFAESLREYVLSAEVIRGGAREVYLASARREPARAAAAAVTLERRLIWEQEAPVLDVLAAGALVYVLEPARLAAYRNRQLLSGIVLGPLPPARDPRGRLELAGDTIVARFPFVTCRAPLGLESAVCTAAEPQAQTGAVESAAADTPCGRYTLLTRPTDPTEPDAIQAYDASGKAAGDPAEFSGPVTALWPGSEGITAISRNLRTGNYGAFRITIACGP